MKDKARAKLIELIERWLESGKNHTMQLLSVESGVSYSTIRKILEGETYPDTDREQALLLIVATDDEIEDYINEYQPTTRELIKRTRKNSETNNVLSQRFWDQNVYWISAQAYSDMCTKELVKEQLGDIGLNTLDALIQEKALILSDGKFRPNKEKPFMRYHSPEAVKHAIIHGADESLKHSNAHRSVATFNVSKEAFEDIKDGSHTWFTNATIKAKENEGQYLISFAIYVTPVIEGENK